MTDQAHVDELRAAADMLRPMWPDKAEELDRAIDDLVSGNREALSINISIHSRLEKFDGDIEPGKVPVEVIESEEHF